MTRWFYAFEVAEELHRLQGRIVNMYVHVYSVSNSDQEGNEGLYIAIHVAMLGSLAPPPVFSLTLSLCTII